MKPGGLEAMAGNKALELATYYSRDLPAFAADCLKIKLESGGISSFVLNPSQMDLHRRLEQQKALTGKIRAILLKPRREGFSTYIGSRFFHNTIFNYGMNTRITTHRKDATHTLFKMVKLFHQKMPDALRPQAKENSTISLSFTHTEGEYALSTANSEDAGRSGLSHYFHGSEVAYWSNAEEVVAASVSTVGHQPGTEIIFESTGAPGTYFQQIWDDAVAGNGEYMPLFYPWYKSMRNRLPAEDLILLPEEKELIALYPGMTIENIAFRRSALELLSETKFKREYPATPAEAFTADDKSAFIPPEIVQRARNRKLSTDSYAPRILGCDPSQTENGDKNAMVIRQGRRVLRIAQFNRADVKSRADVIRNYFMRHDCDHLFIDQGGSGKEIYDLLLSWGMPSRAITFVPFGAAASDNKEFKNKRNEMYYRMKVWLRDEGDIPDNEALAAEISLTKKEIDNDGREVLESKKKMSKSPNLADALALTFAYPVSRKKQRTLEVSTYL